MNAKIRALVFVAMGVSLLVVGINMRHAVNTWEETQTTETPVPGTKAETAAVGAGVGAVGGGILAAVVGGIGVVVAGTGIGLPAGAALIATAAAIGAGAGGVTGAAMGKSDTVTTVVINITRSAPAYETWQWGMVFAVGVVLLLFAVLEIKKLPVEANPAKG